MTGIGKSIPGYIFVFLVCSLAVTEVMAGRITLAQGLDNKLGVRFQSPVTANMRPGSQVQAVVTSPDKLKGLGLGQVKQGDRVTLVKGQGDAFTVRLGSQSVPMMLLGDGSVRHMRQRIGTQAPAGSPAHQKGAPLKMQTAPMQK
ncbi:MAG: hypothetical protein AABZ50_00340 [Pseudomonadota bacterium]